MPCESHSTLIKVPHLGTIKKVIKMPKDKDDVKVSFRHLAEHEKAKFDVDGGLTLQAIWDQAYIELEIDRGERDVLQAPGKHDNPVSLMEHLGVTLDDARARELCDRDFEIAARTGGA